MKRNGCKFGKTSISINESEIGESIEQKLREITATKQPIENTAELIYTDYKDGVRADTDIRTDRWEIANEKADALTRSNRAKRNENHGLNADGSPKAEPTE